MDVYADNALIENVKRTGLFLNASTADVNLSVPGVRHFSVYEHTVVAIYGGRGRSTMKAATTRAAK